MPRQKPAKLSPEEEAQLKRLREKEKALKIEQRRIQANANKRARDADRQLTSLIGVAVRHEAERNPAYKAPLVALLTRFFTRDRERLALEPFGVPPLPAPAGQPETRPDSSPAEVPAVAAQGFGDGLRMVRH
jgi:hypothetical protein